MNMQAPAGVQPQPTPTSWTVGHGLTGPAPIVIVQLGLVTGMTVLFLEPGDARQLGAALLDHAKRATTSLIVPAPHIPPDVLGNGRRT